jgi:hypothetical protein
VPAFENGHVNGVMHDDSTDETHEAIDNNPKGDLPIVHSIPQEPRGYGNSIIKGYIN